MTVRTRFAPSPTGSLHIGGARTALYAWLYAKKHHGQFILRIEDTDRERSTQESVQAILDGMKWLNLDYDEGPFYQTQRFDRYREVSDQLIAQGQAYRCTCSKERLEQLREQQMSRKEKPRYDGLCRDKMHDSSTQEFVVRFRNPVDGDVVFDDQVYGTVTVSNQELDDLIIVRSDGTPTYNFTVVVDDADMKITHVIRGDDHINNTPRQINVLRALNAQIPIYAHLPMILGSDGKRLSKRHGATGVMQYREDGFLPDALINYLVRLGWSHGDQEIFSIDELIQYFEVDAISRAAAALNPDKLLWMNQHYLKTKNAEELVNEFAWQLQRAEIDYQNGPALRDVIAVQVERCKTLKEMAEKSVYFFQEVDQYDAVAAEKNLTSDVKEMLQFVCEKIRSVKWSETEISQLIADTAEKFDLKMAKIAQPIRVALTGNTISPSIDKTIYLIGAKNVEKRLEKATEYIARKCVDMI